MPLHLQSMALIRVPVYLNSVQSRSSVLVNLCSSHNVLSRPGSVERIASINVQACRLVMPIGQTESAVKTFQTGIEQHQILTTAQECSCACILSSMFVDDLRVPELGTVGELHEPQVA